MYRNSQHTNIFQLTFTSIKLSVFELANKINITVDRTSQGSIRTRFAVTTAINQ